MTKEQVIEIMINTVNEYNVGLMREINSTEEQINSTLENQRPALEHMFGMIYDQLHINNVFA